MNYFFHKQRVFMPLIVFHFCIQMAMGEDEGKPLTFTKHIPTNLAYIDRVGASPSAGWQNSKDFASGYVNTFTGQAAFSKELASVGANNNLNFPVTLQYYGGNIENLEKAYNKYAQTSFFGLGFHFGFPRIYAKTHKSVDIHDDEYFLESSIIGRGKLIHISGDSYVLKTNRAISLTRHMVDDTVLNYWTVKMPNGVSYIFGSKNGQCSEMLGNPLSIERCVPIHSHTLGWVKVKDGNLAPPKGWLADTWRLSRIIDREGKFNIVFASGVHELSIYSLNVSSTEKIEEVKIKFKEKANYFKSRALPHYRTQPYLIDNIKNFSNGVLVRKLTFKYGKSQKNKEILGEIQESVPYKPRSEKMLSRNYLKFTYYNNPPRGVLKYIEDKSGVIREYGYNSGFSLPPSAGRQLIQLNSVYRSPSHTSFNLLLWAGITDPKEIFYREIGKKFYLGISNSSEKDFRKILIEFENMGTYYKIKRAFKSFWDDPNEIQLAMSPTGSYFVWASEKHVQVVDLKRDYRSENLVLIGRQGQSDCDFYYENESYFDYSDAKFKRWGDWYGQDPELEPDVERGNLEGFRYGLHLFGDWFAVADRWSPSSKYIDAAGQPKVDRDYEHSIRFYGIVNREGTARWEGLGCNLSIGGRPIEEGEQKKGCIDFQNVPGQAGNFWMSLSAQSGNGYLAALHTTYPQRWPYQRKMFSVLHIYTKAKDKIVEKALPGGYPGALNIEFDDPNIKLRESYVYDLSNPRDPTTTFFGVGNFTVGGDKIAITSFHLKKYKAAGTAVFFFNGEGFEAERGLYHKEWRNCLNNPKWRASHLVFGPHYYLYNWGVDIHYPTSITTRSIMPKKNSLGYSSWVTYPFYKWDAVTSEDFVSIEEFYDEADKKNMHRSVWQEYNGKGTFLLAVKSFDDFKNIGYSENIKNMHFLRDRIVARGGAGILYSRIDAEGPVNGLTYQSFSDSRHPFLLSTGVVLLNGAELTFVADLNRKLYVDGAGADRNNQARVVSSFTTYTKGLSNSNTSDGSKQIVTFDYDDGGVFYKAASATPNFETVVISSPQGVARQTYYCSNPNSPYSEYMKHGTLKKHEFGKGNLQTGPDRMENNKDYRVMLYSKTSEGAELPEESGYSYGIRTVKSNMLNKFWTNSKKTDSTRFTFFDSYNNVPKIRIRKIGGEFHLDLIRFAHEFGTPARPYDRVVQTASYIFTSDPCADAGADPDSEDECSNVYNTVSGVPLAFLLREENTLRAVSSNVNKYNGSTLLLEETWQWMPEKLGVNGLTSIDGSMSSGKWRRIQKILKRARENPPAKCKSIAPTIVRNDDVFSVNFLGGNRCDVLASVVNSKLHTCAVLNAEEDISGAGMGSFGRWVIFDGAGINSDISHTGRNSIFVNGAFGPAINIKIHEEQDSHWDFWNRKKGLIVSAWLYVTGKNDDSSDDPMPMFMVEFRDPDAPSPVVHTIDLVAEYENSIGLLPYNRWIKLERIISYEEMQTYVPESNDFLVIWIGKQPTCTPTECTSPPVHPYNGIYIDDVWIYPEDATVNSWNYDDYGRVTSTIDDEGELWHMTYDAWHNSIGVKDKTGNAFSSSAVRLYNE